MKMFILIAITIIALIVIAGCDTGPGDGVIFDNDRCPKSPGTYCHTFRVQNGTVNLNFSSVVNGTFQYAVDI